MTNLANILTESARRHPDRPAIRLNDILITYAELDELTARAAGWLRARGIEPGDRVAIALPNVVPFPVFYYAALRAGATVVPMNPLLKSREIEHHLGDSGAKLALVWSTVAAEATSAAKATGTDVVVIDDDTLAATADWPSSPAVAARDDADTAVILYTSGTTGTPERCTAHPRQSVPQRHRLHRVVRPMPERRRAGLSAAVSRIRAEQRTERVDCRWRKRVTGSAIRAHSGIAAHRTSPGDRLRRRPHDVRHPAPHRRRRGGAIQPADVCLRRCSAAGRSAQRLPGNLRRTDPRRLRTVRDLTDRRVQPSRANQSRFDRTAARRCRNEIGQPRRHRNPARRGRRNRHPRAQRDERLLEAARRHRGRDRRRLVPHRRHGHPRRRRLLLHRRPQKGHHHPRRLQRLPTRNRRSPLRTPRSTAKPP